MRRSLPFTSAASVHTSWPGSCRLGAAAAHSVLGHPSGLGLCSRRLPCSLGTSLRFGTASQGTFPPTGDNPYGLGLSCAAPRQGSPQVAGKSQNGGDSAAKACTPAQLQAITIPRRYSRPHRRPLAGGRSRPSLALAGSKQAPPPPRPACTTTPARSGATYVRERIPRMRIQASGVITAISATGFGRNTAGLPSAAA